MTELLAKDRLLDGAEWTFCGGVKGGCQTKSTGGSCRLKASGLCAQASGLCALGSEVLPLLRHVQLEFLVGGWVGRVPITLPGSCSENEDPRRNGRGLGAKVS